MIRGQTTKKQVNPRAFREFIRVLHHLRSQQERLLSVIQKKADAMRRADTTAMQAESQGELLILSRIEQHEKGRIQLARSLAQQVGLGEEESSRLTVSRLAIRCPAPMRRELLEAGEALRLIVARVQHANRIAGVVSREILNHMKYVFGAARPAEASPSGYGGDGIATQSVRQRIFETVG